MRCSLLQARSPFRRRLGLWRERHTACARRRRGSALLAFLPSRRCAGIASSRADRACQATRAPARPPVKQAPCRWRSYAGGTPPSARARSGAFHIANSPESPRRYKNRTDRPLRKSCAMHSACGQRPANARRSSREMCRGRQPGASNSPHSRDWRRWRCIRELRRGGEATRCQRGPRLSLR